MPHEIILIDFSSLAVPIWKMCGSEPDPNAASIKMVERVRAIAGQNPHVAICMDSGKSFRCDLDPSYKANRPLSDEPMHHQIRLAEERLAADGFPIWKVRGFEADDVLASATARALETPDLGVLVVSADKDLLQLVGPRVRVMNARDGSIFDAAAVAVKFGVQPDQMTDYLTLVGDASDNIKGCDGIGPKKAMDLLIKYGTLESVYRELAEHGSQFKPAMASALQEFRQRMTGVRQLITLRKDVDVPFVELASERVPKEAATFGFDVEEEEMEPEQPTVAPVVNTAAVPPATEEMMAAGERTVDALREATAPQALAVREPDAIVAAPAEWERQLDPRSMRDARLLAKDMYESRMFSAYGTPQAVLSTVMVGRELGLPAMASLRTVHVIEGKHALSASLMVALVLKSGLAEYFEPVEFSETTATFETKRKGARNPVKLTHTFEMGKQAFPKSKPDWEKSFLASGWGRNPTDMVCARAQARLARLIYPDLLAGLYTPEELEEIRESVAA